VIQLVQETIHTVQKEDNSGTLEMRTALVGELPHVLLLKEAVFLLMILMLLEGSTGHLLSSTPVSPGG